MTTFDLKDFQAWWFSRSSEEQQAVKDKANWEHMTLSAVAIEWFGWKPKPFVRSEKGGVVRAERRLELDERVRLVGDSCLVCGFAKPKGVWVGEHPEWYVCEDCRRKVHRWPQVQTLYRAVIALEDLMHGTIGYQEMPWPEKPNAADKENGGFPVAMGLAKALDPFRYEDKDDDEIADAVALLQVRGFTVAPRSQEKQEGVS